MTQMEGIAEAGTDREDTTASSAVGTSKSNVTIVRRATDGSEERVFHIIGTAHVSKKSVEEVKKVIHELKPDTVCVELDQMRYEALTDESRWRKLDIFDVIRQRKVLFLMMSLALQIYQKRIGEKLGVRPGSELLAAVNAAREVGAEVVLADRDVQATLRRTWASMRFFSKLQVIAGLFAGLFEVQNIDEEQVEALKDRDHITAEFARLVPDVKVPLIDERDQYMMSMIEDAPGKTVVAVVGAGHVDGMTKNVGKSIDRESLTQIPPPSKLTRALKWVIPTIVLVAFAWGYFKHQGEDLQQMLYAWVLPNMLFAALFTLLAGGKLLSVLAAAVASPITSLNPTIQAGMVVGLVEAWRRRPTVDDCERLGREVTTLRQLHANPFSRVLIVALAGSLGSAVGAYVGLGWLFALL